MVAYTYTSFVAALVAETNIEATNAGLVAVLPTIIGQAEGMIYREPSLQFLSTIQTNDSLFTVANQRLFTLPIFYTILHSVNLVQGNDRPPLVKISREAMDALFPRRIANAITDIPTKWAPLTDQQIILGPCPGGTFQIECVGQVNPSPLSASNPQTWLSQYLGDLFFAASMYFASGYMRNFGSQADDPKMAMSWKNVYDSLLPGASTDEMRRKHEATGGAS